MDKEVTQNLSGIRNKILVFSGKGGVGKSTFAVNLARTLAQKGNKVGLLDVDIHGPNVPKMLGLEKEKALVTQDNMIQPIQVEENFKVMSVAYMLESPDQAVIWRGPMKYNVIKQFLSNVQWGELDYLVIDSPPGTGDEPLTIGQLIPDAGAVVVTTPQEVSILDSRKAVSFAKTLQLKILGVVENMSGYVCPHCGNEVELFQKGGGEIVAGEMKQTFLGAIPFDPQMVMSGDAGKSMLGTQSPAAKAIMNITDKIIEQM